MRLLFAAAASALLAAPLVGDEMNNDRPRKEMIRVMPVGLTPEPSTTILSIAVPKAGEVVDGNPVWLQFRVDGYTLGSDSQFDRASEVVNSNMGQTVHVVIDDLPYFPVNEPAVDPFNEDGFYYDMSYKFKVPFHLKEGIHTVRMFAARSFGESLKGNKVFQAMHFYVGAERGRAQIDLDAPYLTYNEPSDQIYLVESKPVLLDFWICNCELTRDGYKVRLTIDGKTNRLLTSWQPFYIYGLRKGKHTIRLELLDARDKLVSGAFNSVERTINVH